MSTKYTELRSQSTQVDVQTSAPTGEDLYSGRIYFDSDTGRLYAYNGSSWEYARMTSTSTSTTSSSTSSTSTSSTSTSSTSSTTSTTSSSSSSSSTSTTLY